MQTITQTEEKPLGVIEALQLGFDLLNHHLWILFVPVLLDVFLWLGPRISLEPLVQRFLNSLAEQPDLPEQFAASFNPAIESLSSLGANYNLLSLLTGPITGMPALLARFDYQPSGLLHGQIIQLSQWQSALVWALILIPAGIGVGSFWLTLIALGLKHERFPSAAFLSRWGWVWLNINLYLIVLIVGIALFSLLFGLLGVTVLLLFGSVGAVIFWILWLFFVGFSLWLSVGLYFVVNAIALDGVNLASAIWRSLNVVGRNAMSTLGFLLLALLLTEGFTRIWVQLSKHAWGVFLSIVGNAYLATAIATAAFLFYQSRYHHWQKTRTLVMLDQRSEQEA